MAKARQLTAEEIELLTTCEATIRMGLDQFIQAAEALEIIKARKLYRSTHRTFQSYMAERWNMSREMGYRMIEQAGIIKGLSGSSVQPTKPSQVRPLLGVESADERREIWDKAVDKAAGQVPTGKQVTSAKVEVQGHSRAWPGTGVKFVQDLNVMADRLTEHYSEQEIHQLVSLLMFRLMRRAA